jgi:hypothetical protein
MEGESKTSLKDQVAEGGQGAKLVSPLPPARACLPLQQPYDHFDRRMTPVTISVSAISDDVLLYLCGFLSNADLLRMMCSCKRWLVRAGTLRVLCS